MGPGKIQGPENFRAQKLRDGKWSPMEQLRAQRGYCYGTVKNTPDGMLLRAS